MTTLNSKKILEENNGCDPNSISSLTLTHRALSDVSCLAEFKNLERLDLGFNSLTSLEGLKSCVNLKWLSVVQNKLQSLEGIQGLSKLTVLNAGKNKLKSMDGVRSLVSLRAIILNDNEITSICKLDKMKELNTLVLSRNPVSEIGDSLVKTKSITKLSLSNCQLQTIGSSLASCPDLKELRLAHNEVKTLPVELSRNVRLLNLDLGNNLIMNLSDLKVLSSLVNLRNLNLQGNPISEEDTLAKKIKKLLPNLKIFNARPTDKTISMDGQRSDRSLIEPADQNEVLEITPAMGKKNPKKKFLSDEEDVDSHDTSGDGANELLKEQPANANENHNAEKKRKKKSNSGSKQEDVFAEGERNLRRKKQKEETENTISTKGDGKSKKKLKQKAGSVIDDGEAPFAELLAAENDKNRDQEMAAAESGKAIDSAGGFVTFPKKNKKGKGKSGGARASIADLSQVDEVGLGGASTWDG